MLDARQPLKTFGVCSDIRAGRRAPMMRIFRPMTSGNGRPRIRNSW